MSVGSDDNEVIPASDKDEIQRALKSGGVEACKELIRRKKVEWKNTSVNVAVIGNSGVGKSSFINAIRRLTADDDGAADVSVTETTTNIRAYPHPKNPNLKFWDVPGVGTDTFPKNGYLQRIKFDRYDFFLLLSATRFTENDTWLAQEITKTNRNFFFVRTKLALDILSNKQSHPKTHNKLAVIMKTHEDIQKHLETQDKREAPIFLIDSYKPQKFDFEKLEQGLIESLSELKRSVMILSMYAYSQEMVQLKVKELRSSMWKAAALSGAVGALPVPGLSFEFDMSIVLSETKFYFEQLGLDDKSLRNHAALMMADYDELKAIVDRAVRADFLTLQRIKAAVQQIPSHALVAAVAEPFRIIPIIGSLIAAPISFGNTYAVLDHMLKFLKGVALQVVTYASEHCGINDDDDDEK